jgi:hypothetical protein
MMTTNQNLIAEINETVEELFWIFIEDDMNVSIWLKKEGSKASRALLEKIEFFRDDQEALNEEYAALSEQVESGDYDGTDDDLAEQFSVIRSTKFSKILASIGFDCDAFDY